MRDKRSGRGDGTVRGQARAQRSAQAPALGYGYEAPSPRRQNVAPASGGPSRPRWLVPMAAFLVVGVIGVSVYFWLRHTPSPTTNQGPFPTVLTFAHDPIACPASAIWSPDSRRIAVLGFSACPQDEILPASGPASGATMTLYQADTGQPAQTTDLGKVITDKALPAAVRGDATALSQAQVLFGAMLWSPDGHQVAFGFSTFHVDSNGNGQAEDYATGLMVVPDAGTPRALVAPAVAPSVPETSFAPLKLTRWDLTANSASTVAVAQALAYAWDAKGALSPTLPLPSSPSATPAPATVSTTGNPAGGANFASWQSGSLGYGSSCAGAGASPNCCTNTSFLSAMFGTSAAWSPDGRYVLMQPGSGGINIGALGAIAAPPVDPATVPGACATAPSSSQFAALPVRDEGLRNGLRAFDLSRVGLVVAWSRDGRSIAVRADHSLSGAAHELSIYDCVTGKLLGAYSAQQVEHGLPSDRGNTTQFGIGLPPVWSPDGTHLLVLDNDLRVLSILGPNMIGR